LIFAISGSHLLKRDIGNSRDVLSFVMAGLDPAIHGAAVKT
jgi:hypothetical protein